MSPELITAIFASISAVAAGLSVVFSRRSNKSLDEANKIAEQLYRDNVERDRRKHAEAVSFWVARHNMPDGEGTQCVVICNSSNTAITEVLVTATMNGRPCELSSHIAQPGELFADWRYGHWNDRSRPFELLLPLEPKRQTGHEFVPWQKGENWKAISIRFTDVNGHRWEKNDTGLLDLQPQSLEV